MASLNVSGCVGLKYLYGRNNKLTALNLSGCTNLTWLDLMANQLTDLSALVTNAAQGGLGVGDTVYLYSNPLSQFARTNQLFKLTNTYHVTVYY